MKTKKPVMIIIASIGLAFVSFFCALTIIGIVNQISPEDGKVEFFGIDAVKATTTETLTIDSTNLTEVRFELDISDIEITGGEDDKITLELFKTGWANTAEEAERAVNELSLEQELRGEKLTFTMSRKSKLKVFPIQSRADTIDISLSIPRDMKISLQINSGQITASNFKGNLSIVNKFGNTSIVNFSGGLTIGSDNGNITITSLSVNQLVSLSSKFGDIFIREINAPEIRIENHNGKLNLHEVSVSGDCLLTSDFTNIEIDSIECGTLAVESKNGQIELHHGEILGPLIITTDFGDMSVKDLTAESYNFTSHNGIIYADTLQGAATINGNFGNIELYSQDKVILNVENQDGDVYFQGLLSSQAEHSVHSTSGKIEFHIPADSSFDLYLSSDFGKIETEFPLNLTGEFNPNKMEGQINSGGPLLTLESKNGDITLDFIKN